MEKIKSIQLSPIRVVPDVITVWNKPGPEVDIVMDLHNLTFQEGSLEEIFSFHVLQHLFIEEIPPAIENWYKCLKKGGEIYIVSNDYEFIARSFVGGDIAIEDLNKNFSCPTQLTKEYLIDLVAASGFKSEAMKVWYLDVPNKFKKAEHELVLSGTKHE